MTDISALHVPRMHKTHKVRCGCAEPPFKGAIVCTCGAAYEALEVLSFPRWRCYDCGLTWIMETGPSKEPRV